MTLSVTTTRVDADGNDSATTFSFSPMVVFDTSEISVTHVDADGVETELSEGTGASNYSVTMNSGNFPKTGSITYPADEVTPLPTGESLVIRRVLPLTQSTNLAAQRTYSAESNETALDRIVAMVQQLQETLDRAVLMPLGEDITSTPAEIIQDILNNASMVPTTFTDLTDTPSTLQSQDAGKAIRVNSSGTALEFVSQAGNWAVPWRGCVCYLNSAVAAQTWANTLVSWDAEDVDTDGFHDTVTNNSRITIPASSGITRVRLGCNIRTNSFDTPGSFAAAIRKNGAFTALDYGVAIDGREDSNFTMVNVVTGPISVTDGDYFTVDLIASQDTTVGLETAGSNFWLEVLEVDNAEERPYDLNVWIQGQPANGDVVFQHVFTRATNLPLDADGSQGYAITAPAAAASFDIQKNGVSIGSLNIAMSANTATFDIDPAVSFAIGDRLTIVAPSPQDGSLADISFAFKLELT